MAASCFPSSSQSHAKIHQVFPSFHGPDVRRGFLSHLHSIFARKEIPMFKDQEIKRGNTIGSELVQGIREARASLVVLSKNYASSTWCLDELLEILECKKASGQIVLPIFYDVDPSDVRKQKGDFGIAFLKTCEGETEEKKQRWIEAFAYVATIAGEHSRNWTDEAAMLEKISTDVLNKLIEDEVKRQFMSIDVDHNGYITAPKFRCWLTKESKKVITDELLSTIIRAYDVDGDGRINYDEFFKMMTKDINEEAAMVKNLATDVTLSSREKKEMMELFMSFDVAKSGFITAEELTYVMTKRGVKVTEEEVHDTIRAADVNGDGRISFDEFVKVMMAENIDEEAVMFKKLATDVTLSSEENEEMMEAFMVFDVAKSGFITAAELQYVMTKLMGVKKTEEEVRDMIKTADLDGDGRISYDEFVKMMTNSKQEAANLKKFSTDVKLSREEEEEMMQMFMILDVDKNGFITAAEYQLATTNVTDEGACNFIRAFDLDGDGQVSYDEFVKLMTKKTGLEKFGTKLLGRRGTKNVKRFAKFMAKALT